MVTSDPSAPLLARRAGALAWPRWAHWLVVALAAAVWLGLWSTQISLNRLHVDNLLNDQITFTTAARHLAGDGSLESSVVYVGTLLQPYRWNYVYMPGYALLLAGVYALLGYSVVASLLPSWLSFVLGAVLLFALTARVFDRPTAYVAALAYVLFPVFTFYAFTAQPDVPLIALTLGAVLLFLATPARYQGVVGAALVGVLFGFKETLALVGLIMLLVLWRPTQRAEYGPALVFGLLSAAAVLLVNNLPYVTGRIQLLRFTLYHLPLYDDIAANGLPTGFGWVRLILPNLRDNLGRLGSLAPAEAVTLAVTLLGSLVGCAWGLARPRANRLLFANGLAGLAMLAAHMLFYDIGTFRGVRSMMTFAPFSLLTLAGAGMVLFRRLPSTRLRRTVASALVLVGVAVGGLLTFGLVQQYLGRATDALMADKLAFVESLGHADETLLVGPVPFFPEYLDAHFPVHYAFLPRSRPAFELLQARFTLGTVIVPADWPAANRLTFDDLQQLGLQVVGETDFNGKHYLIYRPAGQP
jgi:hypothetical protein